MWQSVCVGGTEIWAGGDELSEASQADIQCLNKDLFTPMTHPNKRLDLEIIYLGTPCTHRSSQKQESDILGQVAVEKWRGRREK